MAKSSIYQIAKITGFAPSTVSRALNSSGYCSPKTKQVIMDAANQIGFRPSSSARALKSNRTNRILFCIPDICNPFYFDMIKGANDVFGKHDVYAMLCYTEHSLAQELKFIELLMERYGDGMILVSFNFCEENINAIQQSGYPVVLTNLYEDPKNPNEFDCVYVDHMKAMYIAAGHLIEQGHEQIALIIGDTSEQTSKERATGYFLAMEEAGLSSDRSNLFFGDFTKDSGYEAMKQIIQAEPKYTAVIVANDLMSVGAVSACSEAGVRIPLDMALVSMDNTDFALAIQPNLTSIDMMQAAIGENAATLLMERIESGRTYAKNVRLEPRLIVRGSSVGTQL